MAACDSHPPTLGLPLYAAGLAGKAAVCVQYGGVVLCVQGVRQRKRCCGGHTGTLAAWQPSCAGVPCLLTTCLRKADAATSQPTAVLQCKAWHQAAAWRSISASMHACTRVFTACIIGATCIRRFSGSSIAVDRRTSSSRPWCTSMSDQQTAGPFNVQPFTCVFVFPKTATAKK